MPDGFLDFELRFQQKQEKRKLARAVYDLYQRSRDSSAVARNIWDNCRDFYYGKQLVQGTDTPDTGWHVYNYVQPAVNTAVAMITSEMPRLLFEPVATRAPQNEDLQAYALNQIHPQIWDSIRGDELIVDFVMNAARYGAGFMSVEWDPYARGGMGEVALKNHPPHGTYWDPLATSIEDATYIMFAEEMSRGRVKAMWGKEVESAPWEADRFIRHGEADPTDMVTVITAWIRQGSDAFEKGEVDTFNTERGRKIVISGNTVLLDIPNPYADGQIPVVFLPWTPKPNEFLGVGMIEAMKDAQMTYNDLQHMMWENLRLTGMNVILTRSPELLESLTNKIGQIIPTSGDQELKFQQGLGFPPQALALAQTIKGDIYDIGGRPEAPTEAVTKSHPASGRALEAHASQRATRFRLAAHTYRSAVKKIGRLMLSRYKQFYIQNRVFRITDDMGQSEAWTFNGDDITGEWNIKVDMDSLGMTSYQERFQLAATKMQMGVYDVEDFVNATRDPYKAQVLRKYQDRKRQEQQMQQAQMQQQMQAQQAQQQRELQAKAREGAMKAREGALKREHEANENEADREVSAFELAAKQAGGEGAAAAAGS